MKPIDVQTNTHTDFNVENINKDPKFKVQIKEYFYLRLHYELV